MKDIAGYEGRYAITEDGQVWSHLSSRFKKTVPHKNIYPTITLVGEDGKIRGYLVHRLVAAAYIPNPEDKPHVNHKDSNRTNNHVDNLEWCTRSENMIHAMRAGRFEGKLARKGTRNGNAKLTDETVRLIRSEVGITQKQIAKKYNISSGYVTKLLSNQFR